MSYTSQPHIRNACISLSERAARKAAQARRIADHFGLTNMQIWAESAEKYAIWSSELATQSTSHNRIGTLLGNLNDARECADAAYWYTSRCVSLACEIRRGDA